MEKFIKIVYFSSSTSRIEISDSEWLSGNYIIYVNPHDIIKISDIFDNRVKNMKYFFISLRNNEIFWCRCNNGNYQFITDLLPLETPINNQISKITNRKKRIHD